VSEREHDDHAGGEQEQRPAGGAEGAGEQELSQHPERSRDRVRELHADEPERAEEREQDGTF